MPEDLIQCDECGFGEIIPRFVAIEDCPKCGGPMVRYELADEDDDDDGDE